MTDSAEGEYLVHSEASLLDTADRAVQIAHELGAEAASALASESAGITVKVRQGAPFHAVRDGAHSLSITVYDRGRTGKAVSEALDASAIRSAVEKALGIAKQVEGDPDARPADVQWLATDGPSPPLYLPSGRDAGSLIEIARSIERAALSKPGAGVTRFRVDEAGASSSDSRWARVMTGGFARSESASVQARACVVIAENDSEMARDWWHVVDRREPDLVPVDVCGSEARNRAAAKLGGRALPTQSAAVLLDARVAASLIGELVNGLMGQAQHQRATFLAGSLGESRLASHIDLVENPIEPFGLASSGWDSEGIAPAQRHVVNGGTIEGYFLNSRFARKLGLTPTGSADGPTNLTLSSRTAIRPLDIIAMLKLMNRGLWVTGFLGGGVNQATGTYSKAVEGFWIENGEIAYPVANSTIAGNLSDMFARLVGVGTDVFRSQAFRTGSILLDEMRIAGL